MFENFKRDLARYTVRYTKPFFVSAILALLYDNGMLATVCYRIGHWFNEKKIPIVPFIFNKLSIILTGVDIDPRAKIGPGLLIVHGVGIVIHHSSIVGDNLLILHGVTLGFKDYLSLDAKAPTLGNNVTLSAGAKILGNITIEDNVLIGANAVVTESIPANSVAVGIPAKVVKSNKDVN